MNVYIIKIIGIIFCQVAKIKQFNQFKFLIILINHEWKGEAPIFIRIDKFNKIIIIEFILKRFNNWKLEQKIKIDDENAWIIKYFIELFL